MGARRNGALLFHAVGIIANDIDKVFIIENFGKLQDRQGNFINVARQCCHHIMGHKRGLLKVLGQSFANTDFRIADHQTKDIFGQNAFAVRQSFC